MSAKDNSMSFDFWGTYENIEIEKSIEILLGDGRKMKVNFDSSDTGTIVTEEFEPEQENPTEMQRAGWQMILDNFKKYVEK
jgi:Activator of Hsp90 ATPase homolog 1-like protein